MVERDFLAAPRRGGLGPVDFDFVPGARRVGGLHRLAVDENEILADEPLHRAARKGGEFFTEKNIQPPPGRDCSTMKFSTRSGMAFNPPRLGVFFVSPGDEKNQGDAGADGGIGDVEGGEADFHAAAPLHVK